MEELWTALYHWFIDNRRFMKGRLGPRQLKPFARMLHLDITQAMIREGKIPQTINLDSNAWWVRWRLWARISWRKPTRKFKVSFAKYMARTRVYHCGLFLIRWFFVKAFGVDPEHWQSDQKGVQVNTATSKNAPTLERSGVRDVQIKDNAPQSRERISMMTTSRSTDYAAPHTGGRAAGLPPSEILG